MASTNLWPVLMRIIFPIPASFLFLVCLPLPSLARRFVNRWVLRPFDKIFSFRVLGAPLIYIIIVASFALFSTMCVETYALGESEGRAADFTEKMNLRGRRWRAERNFYISLMFLSCSILADRVRLMLKETEKLHEQIREMRRS